MTTINLGTGVLNTLYAENSGIKEKLAKWLTKKYYSNLDVSLLDNIVIEPDELHITNGNMNTLHLLISKYNESGDTILVENPTSIGAINIFKEYGLEINSSDMEEDGIDIDSLEHQIKKLDSQSVLFYYMIPTFHNPTGITTSHMKRRMLAKLCDKYKNLYIIADEAYSFLTWSNIISYYPMADYHSKIISMGSFSKILYPELKLGWIYQNKSLENYKLEYSFIEGSSGLNKSSILEFCGLNMLAYKIIDNMLDSNEIDTLLNNNNNKLHINCLKICEYLEFFDNVEVHFPGGGYYIWIKFKTIYNINDFMKICNHNNVTFITGTKFTIYNDFINYGRITFTSNITDIMIGIDRIMDSIKKYNSINILIYGADTMLGLLIKQELISNDTINYMGDINSISRDQFNGMIPFNSIILDFSENNLLLPFLLKEKIYLPIIIKSYHSTDMIDQYKKYSPICCVDNFSQINMLYNDIMTLMKSYNIDNNSENINVSYSVNDNKECIKGCNNMIYWILTQPNGMYNRVHNIVPNYSIDDIIIFDLVKDIPKSVTNYIIEKYKTKTIIFMRNTMNKYNIINVSIYKSQFISYCSSILLNLLKYIKINNIVSDGIIMINSDQYDFKINNDMYMLALPSITYTDINDSDMISELINDMTNITLLGISQYDENKINYLVLEIKDNVFDSETLETLTTLSTLINDITMKQHIIIFINYDERTNNTINIVSFDGIKIIYNDMIVRATAEYYIYHFGKNNKETKINIQSKNNKFTIIYKDNEIYITN